MQKGWLLKRWDKPAALLAGALSLLGGAWIAIQSWLYSIKLISMLDEAAYLYKGWLFVKGVFKPFQDFGPWTNKGPLAFLIPGFFQELLGQGLRSGRLVAVVISLLTVLGLWLTARRLAGRWWAAGLVLALAFNPFGIKLYSQALSQGLVACLLTWSLFFTLGEKRRTWQLLMGIFLAVLTLFTRQNMAPFLPLLIVYIFWQHGKKQGWLALGLSIVLVAIGHALYWPNILQMWTPWLPARLTPFLDFLRIKDPGTPFLTASATQFNRLLGALQGLRFHFAALTGLTLALLFWPRHQDWKSASQFKTSLFLAVLGLLLLVMHAWAALWKDYCTFCFSPYIGFFAPVLLLLPAVSASAWNRKPGWLRSTLAVLVVPVLATGAGYGSFEETGYGLRESFMRLMATQLPRTRDFFKTWKFLPGTVTLEGLIENKLGVVIDTFKGIEIYRKALPAVVGLLVGLAVLLIAWLLSRVMKKRLRLNWAYGFSAFSLFVLTGSLLAPARALGGGIYPYDCSNDSLSSYEQTGRQLAAMVPPGSHVYWDVQSPAAALLLYLPFAQVPPPMINAAFAYYTGGDTRQLLRFGQWNDQAALQFLKEADVIIVEEPTVNESWKRLVKTGYEKVTLPDPAGDCGKGSLLQVYRKVP